MSAYYLSLHLFYLKFFLSQSLTHFPIISPKQSVLHIDYSAASAMSSAAVLFSTQTKLNSLQIKFIVSWEITDVQESSCDQQCDYSSVMMKIIRAVNRMQNSKNCNMSSKDTDRERDREALGHLLLYCIEKTEKTSLNVA